MASSDLYPLPDFYDYYPDFYLLLCNKCHYPITSKKARQHLMDHMTPYQIKQSEYPSTLKTLGLRARGQCYDLIRENQPVPEFPALVTFEGFKCSYSGCGKLFVSQLSLANHLSAYHKVKNPKKNANLLNSSCFLQSLAKARDQYLFEVIQGHVTTNPPREVPLEVPLTPTQPDTILQAYRAHQAALPEPKIELFDSPDEFSTFYKETRFLDFLKGKDSKVLWGLLGGGDVQAPSSNLNLDFLRQASLYTLELGEAMVPYLDRNSLAMLNSFQHGVQTLKIMRKLQNFRSLVHYSLTLHQFFTFLLNSYQLQVSSILDLN
jgi:hypothetical protein